VEELELHIEALIFASEKSISIMEIKHIVQAIFHRTIFDEEIESSIIRIQNRFANEAFHLVYLNNGYQFLTKNKFHATINLLQTQRSKKKLSQASLETLAIIAYKQPITKVEIEQIRGVNCDYTIQRLLEKEFISITGKTNTAGRPLLYSTSNIFIDYFGISSINHLPSINDFSDVNKIGTPHE
jgi:segregation and condensation protein B